MTSPAKHSSALSLATPRPGLAVTRELAHAVYDLLALPGRALEYRGEHDARVQELRGLLQAPAEVEDVPAAPPPRELSVFVSCAEVSGETYARQWVAALRAELAALGAPPARFFGLGGRALAEAGVELLGNPVERAMMGFDYVGGLPFYVKLATASLAALTERRADVAVLVDSPGLHIPLGRVARRQGARVVQLVAPQLWGWAPWRIRGYRDAVDLTLTILPFEKPWFDRRGVRCRYVGHPLLDGFPASVPAFDAPERRALALLAGSREGVLARNLPWMLSLVIERLRADPSLEVVVPHERRELGPRIESLVRETLRAAPEVAARVRVELGDLHASLSRARAAFAVSGTALLDLLHHRLPAVVVYRLGRRREAWMSRRFLTAPFIALSNLLAGREVCPEYCFVGEGPRADVAAALARALDDPAWRRECRSGLDLAHRRLGPPGACRRAARAVLAAVAEAGA